MQKLPASSDPLVIRTDFSNDAKWNLICSLIREPVGKCMAYVEFVDDVAFAGLSIDQFPRLLSPESKPTFLFIVDHRTVDDAESAILVVDVLTEPMRTFRVIPSEMWSVENNLSIANMDWEEFADSTDDDGVFRGFPDVE